MHATPACMKIQSFGELLTVRTTFKICNKMDFELVITKTWMCWTLLSVLNSVRMLMTSVYYGMHLEVALHNSSSWDQMLNLLNLNE